VYCDIWYIFLIPQFLRHQTMDKVQKHNSFNKIYGVIAQVWQESSNTRHRTRKSTRAISSFWSRERRLQWLMYVVCQTHFNYDTISIKR